MRNLEAAERGKDTSFSPDEQSVNYKSKFAKKL